MTKQAEELLRSALQLEQAERAEIAARLLETLARCDADEEVERAWAAEIERRARRVREEGPSGRDGDVVLDRVKRGVLGR